MSPHQEGQPARLRAPGRVPHLGVAQQRGLRSGSGQVGAGLGLQVGCACVSSELEEAGRPGGSGSTWQSLRSTGWGGCGKGEGSAGGTGAGDITVSSLHPSNHPATPARPPAPLPAGAKGTMTADAVTRAPPNSELKVSMGTRVTLCCGQQMVWV